MKKLFFGNSNGKMISFFLFFIAASLLSAEEKSWTGKNSSDWNDSENWAVLLGGIFEIPAEPPGENDKAIIPDSLSLYPVLTADLIVGELENSGELNAEGYDITVSGLFKNDGVLRLSGPSDTVTAGDIDIGSSGSIDAGTNELSLKTVSGDDIRIGALPASQADGVFSLSNDELARITSKKLSFTVSGAGGITADAVSAAASENCGLIYLDVSGAGTALLSGNSVYSGGLEVFQAEGLIEISSGASLVASERSVLLGAFDAKGRFSLSCGSFALAGSSASAASGAVSIQADSVDIESGLDAGTNEIAIYPADASRAISLGAETAGSLSLTGALLDRIKTSGKVTIGSSSSSGAVSVAGALSPSNMSGEILLQNGSGGISVSYPFSCQGDLSLVSGGRIEGSALISVNSGSGKLTVSAGRGISLDNSAGNLASEISLSNSSSEDVTYVNDHSCDISVSNPAGALSFCNKSGALGIGSVSAGGPVSLRSSGSVAQTGAISGEALLLEGEGRYTLTNGANRVDVIASSGTGAIDFANSAPLEIGSVGSINGIVSSGAVSIDTKGNSLTVSQDVSAGGGFSHLRFSGSSLSLAADITASGDPVTFANPVILASDVSITSSGGAVSFSDSVDGAFDLGINSGIGDITFGGDAGRDVPLGNVHFSGAVRFGAGFEQEDTKSFAVDGGSVDVGIGRFCAGDLTVSEGSSFTQRGANEESVVQSVGSITNNGSVVWDSSREGGSLIISGDVGGSRAGDISFNHKTVSFGDSLTVSGLFYDLTIPAGITLTNGDSIRVQRDFTVENGGSYIHDSKVLTLGGPGAADGTIKDSNSDLPENLGAVTIDASDFAKTAGSDLLIETLDVSSGTFICAAHDIRVNGGSSNSGTISCGSGALTLGGPSANSGTVTGGSGTLFFADTLSNSGTIAAGAGGITFGGDYVGAGGILKGDTEGVITFAGDVSLGTFGAEGGTVRFEGTGEHSLITNGQLFYNVSLEAASSSLLALSGDLKAEGMLTVALDNTLYMGPDSGTFSVAGGSSNDGTISCGSGALTFGGPSANSGTVTGGSGTLVFADTLSNSGTIAAGAGGITFGGDYDGRGGTLEEISGGMINFKSNAQFGNFTAAGGTVVFSGTLPQRLSLENDVVFGNMEIDKTSGDFAAESGYDLIVSDLTLTAAEGIVFDCGVEASALIDTEHTGPIAFDGNISVDDMTELKTSGTVTIGDALEDSALFKSGLSVKNASSVILAGDLSSQDAGASISFCVPVTLGKSVKIDTKTGGGDMTFERAITGSSSGGEDLTLISGTGDIFIGGNAGTELLRLGNVSADTDGTVDISSGVSLYLLSFSQSGTGNAQCEGDLTLDSSGAVSFDGDVSTLSGGSLTVVSSGGLLFSGTVITDAGGSLSAVSSGEVGFGSQVKCGGDICVDTSGGADVPVTFNAGVTASGDCTIKNSGLLSIADSEGGFVIAGDFFQDGPGDSLCGASVKANDVLFTGTLCIAGAGRDISIKTEGPAADLSEADIHLYIPGHVFKIENDEFKTRNFVFYGGTLDIGGKSFIVSKDLVVLGTGYDDDGYGVEGLFAYDNQARTSGDLVPLLAPPNIAVLERFFGMSFSPYSASVQNLAGASVSVEGNFYVNGADLLGDSSWTLDIPDNDRGRDAFAEAYNMRVSNCAASHAVACENVSDGTGNSNWMFGHRGFLSASDGSSSGTYTVYDNVIRVEIEDGAFENSCNDIAAAAAAGYIRTDHSSGSYGASRKFTGVFADAECTKPLDDPSLSPGTFEKDISVFYIQIEDASHPEYRWNTDADGRDSGDPISTDRGRSGVRPAHRSSVPNIAAPCGYDDGSEYIYFSLRDSDKNRIEHYINGTVYADVKDGCRPVVVSVKAGTAGHSSSVKEYDGHNYFHIKWSESVEIGDIQGGDTLGLDAENVRPSDASASSAGNIYDSGSKIEVEGFFSYGSGAEVFNSGSRDRDPAVSALYRIPDVNPSGDHGITLYAAGYYDSSSPYLWPGYLGDPSLLEYLPNSDPVGFEISVAEDPRVNASSGLDFSLDVETTSYPDSYDKYSVEISDDIDLPAPGDISALPYAVFTAGSRIWGDQKGWDTEPPAFALMHGDRYEIIAVDMFENNIVSKIEIHIHDDSSLNGGIWNYESDHPDTNIGGLRDVTCDFVSLGKAVPFKINGRDFDDYIFLTSVSSEMFTGVDGALITVPDDQYFSFTFDSAALGIDFNEEISVTYDPSGMLTDLAGNLLISKDPDLGGMEKTPPYIYFTVAVPGKDKVFIKFSKEVETADGTSFESVVSPNDYFEISNGSSVTAIDVAESGQFGAISLYLTLDRDLTVSDILGTVIRAKANSVVDRNNNKMLYERRHRISDFAVDIVAPVWMKDLLRDDFSDRKALRDFTGGGKVYGSAISMEISLNEAATSYPVTLFYDADPPDASKSNDMWLPVFMEGFNKESNSSARSLSPFRSANRIRDFKFAEGDSEIAAGKSVEFIFQLGSLYAARLIDSSDYLSLAPWKFRVESVKPQRSGVTILNNVLNVNKNEYAVLKYSVEKSGTVTVNVFSLAGDLVKTLHKGKQVPGDYILKWNGKNSSGRKVARGIYFIRVVAPDIDEYRKVLIVK